ncbi:MAG TPA: nucleoside deaminase [Clostridiaceae bacterium]|nr:nucleoside deaminase [Clostridiaceae bacterium]
MRQALSLAKKAADIGEVPVGCIIMENNKIIAAEYNRRETDQDATAHAEILALRAAGKHRPSWRLDGCDLYVTLEPCLMCSGAIIQARIRRLIFGAPDPKGGMAGSIYNVFDLPANHQVIISGLVLQEECSGQLKDFFQRRRLMGSKDGF